MKAKASFIEPMLLLRSDTLPEGPDWIYELKLDGYRALAIKAGGKVELRSRNDNDVPDDAKTSTKVRIARLDSPETP